MSISTSLGVIAQEGGVFDSVKPDLHRVCGERSTFYESDYGSICSTSRAIRLDYCQSQLSQQVRGVPTSSAIFSATFEDEKTRLPRIWGSINHDFVVVHMTGTDSQGQVLPFCIVAEKTGEGRRGESAGIYIGVLSEAEIQNLHRNVFMSWDCHSIPVRVDILIKALGKDLDPNYHFLSNNCWNYARGASENVLQLLSKQTAVTSSQKIYFQDRSEEVKNSVLTAATLESTARGSLYLIAGVSVFYGVRAIIRSVRDYMARREEERIDAEETIEQTAENNET